MAKKSRRRRVFPREVCYYISFTPLSFSLSHRLCLTMPTPSAAAPADDADSPAAADSADAAADAAPAFILIHGQTLSGGKFRPSDWCDRLHGTLRVLGDDAEEVAEYVHLVHYEEKKCVRIDTRLQEVHPKVFRFFVNFALNNHLVQQPLSQQDWDAAQR